MKQGFTGISFPFRVGVKGGVVMSTTNEREVPHIIEAMKQILLTRPKERCMEYHFKSEVDTCIFEPSDQSTYTLLEYQIKEALRDLEDRVEVSSVSVFSKDSALYATIKFVVLAYDTSYTTDIKVGDIDVQNSNQRNKLY